MFHNAPIDVLFYFMLFPNRKVTILEKIIFPLCTAGFKGVFQFAIVSWTKLDEKKYGEKTSRVVEHMVGILQSCGPFQTPHLLASAWWPKAFNNEAHEV